MNPDELADNIDFAILNAEAEVSFRFVDWYNMRRREYKKLVEEIEVFRTKNPILFDQLVVIGLAALVEVVASYLKRRA